MKADCPKCGSKSAWYEKSHTDLTLVCMCGVRKVVFTTLQDLEIEHNTRPQDVRLPRQNTNLWHTLAVLRTIAPAHSNEVTDSLAWSVDSMKTTTVSDVSSYLAILRGRGLVTALDSRRGIPGGSLWDLTETARTLLGE